MKATHRFRASTCLFLALFCGACSIGHGKADGEKAVARFHSQYGREQFDSIYTAAASTLRESTSKDEFIRFMTAVHTKLGAVRQSTPSGWRVQALTSGSYVDLTYETDFARGHGTESFRIRLGGDGAKLEGYNINSAALVVN
jgi:Protein of unknown function (DUF4019)